MNPAFTLDSTYIHLRPDESGHRRVLAEFRPDVIDKASLTDQTGRHINLTIKETGVGNQCCRCRCRPLDGHLSIQRANALTDSHANGTSLHTQALRL